MAQIHKNPFGSFSAEKEPLAFPARRDTAPVIGWVAALALHLGLLLAVILQSAERMPPASASAERMPPASASAERMPPASASAERMPPAAAQAAVTLVLQPPGQSGVAVPVAPRPPELRAVRPVVAPRVVASAAPSRPRAVTSAAPSPPRAFTSAALSPPRAVAKPSPAAAAVPAAQSGKPGLAPAPASAFQGFVAAQPLGGNFNSPPVYPDAAIGHGEEGKVLLSIHVLPDGRTDFVSVTESSGYQILDHAAQDTVLHWRFQPAMFAGKRVVQVIPFWINFDLQTQSVKLAQ